MKAIKTLTCATY